MPNFRLDVTLEVYSSVRNFLREIQTFGVQSYEQPRNLIELKLFYANKAALRAEQYKFYGGENPINNQVEDLNSLKSFAEAYWGHLAENNAKPLFCPVLSVINNGPEEPTDSNAEDFEPTVAHAVKVLQATVDGFKSRYQTLLFLAQQNQQRWLTDEVHLIACELDSLYQKAELNLLRFEVLNAVPQSLEKLKTKVKPNFSENFCVMQYLTLGGVTPGGWPIADELNFRADIRAR